VSVSGILRDGFALLAGRGDASICSIFRAQKSGFWQKPDFFGRVSRFIEQILATEKQDAPVPLYKKKWMRHTRKEKE